MTPPVALVRAMTRSAPWPSIAALTGCGGLLLAAAAAAPHTAIADLFPGFGIAILAGAGAFTFDDAAAAVADASPYPRRSRAAARVLCLAPPLVVGASGVVALELRDRPRPMLGLLGVFVGCLALAAAVAAWLRRRDATPGEESAGAVAGTIALTTLYNPFARWVAVLPQPGDERWLRTAVLWAAASVLASGVLVWATRDPLSRRRRW